MCIDSVQDFVRSNALYLDALENMHRVHLSFQSGMAVSLGCRPDFAVLTQLNPAS
jgi:hypothetical protein